MPKRAVEAGKFTWPTLYDAGQKVQDKWFRGGRFLIDHQGIIHRQAVDSFDWGEAIQRLVENAEH